MAGAVTERCLVTPRGLGALPRGPKPPQQVWQDDGPEPLACPGAPSPVHCATGGGAEGELMTPPWAGGGASVGLSRLWVLKGWSGSLPFRIPGTCIRPHLE